jgi:hypothetical protein
MSEMVERFKEDLAEVCWGDLREHLQRDTIITLAAELDLVEAATAVARDDSEKITAWIAAGQLGKPTVEEVTAWEKEMDKPFRVLIVQPYILVQAVCHA